MRIKYANIKVIGFDADDTLWVDEPYYRQKEHQLALLLQKHISEEALIDKLYQVELGNIDTYGFGIKSFMLSMIETAIEVSNGKVSPSEIIKIIDLGKDMLGKDIELLEDVNEVLGKLFGKFRLILVTKGDLLDQERKLKKSGLGKYFHHIEIVSAKHEESYMNLVNHLDIEPAEFLMVGNSLKSDIIPVINIGGNAVFIPYHTTWIHENVDEKIDNPRFHEIRKLMDLPSLLS